MKVCIQYISGGLINLNIEIGFVMIKLYNKFENTRKKLTAYALLNK